MIGRITVACLAYFLFTLHAIAATSTFNFDGSVTSDEIASGAGSFGATGDSATASLTLNYTAGQAIPVGFTSGGMVDFSIASSNFSYSISFTPDGFNDGFNSSINATATKVSFFTSSGSFNWPGIAGNTLRTGFVFTFGTALGSAPTTYDDLATALADPGTALEFLTNGDFLFNSAPGQVFDEYRASLSTTTPVVPLPAAAWMLLTGIFGVFVLGKRKPAH